MTINATLAAPRAKPRAKKAVPHRSAEAGQYVQSISLADPAAAADVAAFRRQVTKSPAAARQWLRQVGILTPTGKLSRRYGGK